MTIRTRLIGLSLVAGVAVLGVTVLFTTMLSFLDGIDREKRVLVSLADSIRDLSVAVNSLESNQYEGVGKRLNQAVDRSEKAFADLSHLVILPKLNADVAKAFEILGNLHGLIGDDLKTLQDQFAGLKPDLEATFLESRSTALLLFYTNDRARAQHDLTKVYAKLDGLTTSITGMTDTLAGLTDTIQSQSDLVNDQTGQTRSSGILVAVAISGVLLVAVVLFAIVLGSSISRRIRHIQSRLIPVSQGDFSTVFPVDGHDEVSGIAVSMNQLLEALNRLLGQVQAQVEVLTGMGSELSTQMGETSRAVGHIQNHLQNSRAQLQAQTLAVDGSLASAGGLREFTDNLNGAFGAQSEILGALSAGIEQIIANIGSVNANTVHAHRSTENLAATSQEGQQRLDSVARSVQEISRSSENLARVTTLINDIADQTNLLAMNASIEAAHAGLSGRGFGVVAQEIRKLAEQAALQSKAISDDVRVVQESIWTIETATGLAVDVFHKIVDQTGQVRSIVEEVKVSMKEQNQGGTLILDGIRRLNEITGQVGQAIVDMKRGEAEILIRIQELARQNVGVNDNNEDVLVRADQINGIVAQTDHVAQRTRQLIVALESETGQFRTGEAPISAPPSESLVTTGIPD